MIGDIKKKTNSEYYGDWYEIESSIGFILVRLYSTKKASVASCEG